MIDWTYTHFRVFMRLLAPSALLYTEMITPQAILHNAKKVLAFHPQEYPLSLQLGGSCPQNLAKASKIAEELGFQEINLNLGCPSDKVKAGHFGACMMLNPLLVKDCLSAIKDTVRVPVSAKIRIGIDTQDSFDFFAEFASMLVKAGCDKLIVHARKAWLTGLSPKQNRTIPPLKYDYVYKLKQLLITTPIIINGNITTVCEIKEHLSHVDGVMIGRLACQNPYAIAKMHQALYPKIAISSRYAVLQAYLQYARQQQAPLSFLIKPIQNLAHGLPIAKKWKNHLQTIQETAKFSMIDTTLFEPESLIPSSNE